MRLNILWFGGVFIDRLRYPYRLVFCPLYWACYVTLISILYPALANSPLTSLTLSNYHDFAKWPVIIQTTLLRVGAEVAGAQKSRRVCVFLWCCFLAKGSRLLAIRLADFSQTGFWRSLMPIGLTALSLAISQVLARRGKMFLSKSDLPKTRLCRFLTGCAQISRRLHFLKALYLLGLRHFFSQSHSFCGEDRILFFGGTDG